jgi:hypothetical protein
MNILGVDLISTIIEFRMFLWGIALIIFEKIISDFLEKKKKY